MRSGRALPAGKLPPALLRRLLARITRSGPSRQARLLIGPGIGLDAAAIDLGDRCLVVKSDPVTFVADEIGVYALTVNANDLATMGARPRWFLASILLPPGSTAPQVSRLVSQLDTACRRQSVALCGGHTEITDAVTRPVIVGCLLGDCPKNQLLTTAGARVGDALLLTKGIPIEAVSILARERAGELRRRYGPRFLARCRRYLTDPGISIVRDAQVALKAGGVHAMHDPTEGGLSAALYELAEAAGVGVTVEERAIHIVPEGARLCADYGVNPLGAIASGALLICAAPGRAPALIAALARAGISAVRIGTVTSARQGVRIVTAGGWRSLPRFATDEITKILQDGQKGRATRSQRAKGRGVLLDRTSRV